MKPVEKQNQVQPQVKDLQDKTQAPPLKAAEKQTQAKSRAEDLHDKDQVPPAKAVEKQHQVESPAKDLQHAKQVPSVKSDKKRIQTTYHANETLLQQRQRGQGAVSMAQDGVDAVSEEPGEAKARQEAMKQTTATLFQDYVRSEHRPLRAPRWLVEAQAIAAKSANMARGPSSKREDTTTTNPAKHLSEPRAVAGVVGEGLGRSRHSLPAFLQKTVPSAQTDPGVAARAQYLK